MSVLELVEVTVRAAGRIILDQVSLRVAPADFVAIVGPNGAGKTSLIRAALGLMTPESGRVTLDSVPVRALSGRARAAKIAWLPQRLEVVEPITAVEMVAAARFRFGESHSRSVAEARHALASVQAEALGDRRMTELSGGEIQRVSLAALLAQDAPLVLLDEPANHLDPAWQMAVYDLIGRVWRSRVGLIWVTHDINAVRYAADADESRSIRVVGVLAGRIEFDVPYSDADLGARLERLFDVQMSTVVVGGRRVFVSEPAPRDDRP